MRYAPYEFKAGDAFGFAKFVGIRHFQHGDELFFLQCPYCKATGKQNEKSFSINLRTGQFKCFRDSCGATGNMIRLSQDFDFSLGNENDEYYRPQRTFRRLKTPQQKIIPKPEAVKYMESRGISQAVTELYEITTQTDKPNILVFPFYDEKGILQFVKYRKSDYDKEKDNNKEWCEANCKPILFGMKQCDPDNRTLIITEGQIDSMSVAECGLKNAVSVPTGSKGFTFIPYCWDWINNFQEIIVFGDYEKGHITLLDELSRRLKITVKHVREEDYLDCKDANDILRKYGKEQVKKCIANAVAVPIKQVIQLAEVEDVDIFKITKLKTGIKQVDRLLYGGLPFGGVVLISGKPGEGKSTLAGQIIVNSIYQGFTTFAYSGELPNYLFKAWLDFQIAGGQHIFEYQNAWGDKNYNISKTNKALINDWYREKCYLYDNTDLNGEEKESLLTVVENAIMQYGVQVVSLDNLMTAIDEESVRGDDKYDRQSNFVKRLTRIALRHNVLILLVAHKRKNNFSQNENDEISGSGDISNLATITIAYETGKDLPDNQRLCKISKNRLFGKKETNGYLLNFDEKSKRIYGQGDDPDFDYGWCKEMPPMISNNAEGFVKVEPNQETPFDTE